MSEEVKLSDREIEIRRRTAAGLSRKQAEEATNSQEAHDADLAKAAKKKSKAADESADGKDAKK